GLLAVVVAAAHAPATLWATQSALIPRGYRLAIVFAVYLAVLLLVANFLHRLGVENAFFSVAMVGLLFSYAARAFDSGSILVLVCVALVVVLHGLRQSRWLHYLMVVLVFVGATGPPAQWLMQFVSRTPSELQTLGQIDSPASAEQPDVWILVLDGYPSSWALENLFGADSAPLADRLQQAGFIVNPNALAPYPWTVAAVASVLESSPVAPPGVRIGHSEMVEVRRLLGGGAATFRALEESGYRTIVLESTWHLSRCNAGVDSCI